MKSVIFSRLTDSSNYKLFFLKSKRMLLWNKDLEKVNSLTSSNAVNASETKTVEIVKNFLKIKNYTRSEETSSINLSAKQNRVNAKLSNMEEVTIKELIKIQNFKK